VVSLFGSRPELWVADDRSQLHFAGDTRALAGRPVDWSFRLQVSPQQLQSLELGDPWLSTTLVTAGQTIYQPRWDTQASAPTLYQVQAVSDLALFGITPENYNTFVLPQEEWERRYGFRVGDLPKQPLAPILGAPPPGPAPAPAPTAVPAPAPQATPLPTAPAGQTATAAPTTPAGFLNHVPVYSPTGGDVSFTLPPGRDWMDAFGALPTLTRLMPTGTLQGEYALGLWRRSASGMPYAYIEATAIDLGPHPDVKGVTDLATLKLRFLRNDSDAFQAGPLQPATAGGQPATQVDTVATRRFSSDPGGRGTVSSGDLDQYVTKLAPGSPVTELTWSARDVFVIRGNWGYDFRLFSTGPGVKSDNEGDLNQLLATLTFNY
jgi:hypothetical protein